MRKRTKEKKRTEEQPERTDKTTTTTTTTTTNVPHLRVSSLLTKFKCSLSAPERMKCANPIELKMTGLLPLLIKPMPVNGFNKDGCA